MSSQPFPPSSGVAAPAPAASGAKRNPVLLVVGAVLVVAGVVAGLVLVKAATSGVADNARDLARAPGGCTTSLQFDTTGEFLVFYESRGRVGQLDGDCGGNGATFDRGDSEPPRQTLSLLDPDDKDVTLDDASGTTYRAGGFTGEEIAKVKIDAAGLYKLTVAPRDADDADYAIAIGKDPTSDESARKALGTGALIAGVVLGALLILLGLRKRGGSTAMVTAIPGASWNPSGPNVTWQTRPQQPPLGSPPAFGTPPPTVHSSYPGSVPWTPAEPTQQQPPPPPSSPFAPPSPPTGAG